MLLILNLSSIVVKKKTRWILTSFSEQEKIRPETKRPRKSTKQKFLWANFSKTEAVWLSTANDSCWFQYLLLITQNSSQKKIFFRPINSNLTRNQSKFESNLSQLGKKNLIPTWTSSDFESNSSQLGKKINLIWLEAWVKNGLTRASS